MRSLCSWIFCLLYFHFVCLLINIPQPGYVKQKQYMMYVVVLFTIYQFWVYQPVKYSPWSGPGFIFYRTWAAFHVHAWCIISCIVVKLIITCSMPATSLLTLIFSPSLFIISFPWFMCIIVPAMYGLGTLLCFTSTVWMKMSSSCPAVFYICLCRYCSVDIRVLCSCFIFHVISLPVFITKLICGWPLWLLSLASSTTLWIHDPLSYQCTATVDPFGKKNKGSSQVSLFLTYFFWWASRASYWAVSLLIFIHSLTFWGRRPFIGL